MPEAFKESIGPELVRTIAQHLRRVDPQFASDRFVKLATKGLGDLELKARVVHVADALAEVLPKAFAKAAPLLERCLAPARSDDDLSQLVSSAEGLAGWTVWPLTDYVARYGLASPKRALRALHAMTQRHTAEFAIRPFLVEHRELTMQTLHDWVRDRSPHVRRLVSEGSRPRLPWGMQLQALVADPTESLPLLLQLQDDPSEYVRRSVANHLNDIAKDHPACVAEWLERHLPGAPVPRRALLRHASRTLIKRGDRRVLQAWGLAGALRGAAELRIEPSQVAVGGAVTLSVELRSTIGKDQQLLVDYVVHHVKQGAATSKKTWKGWQIVLSPGEQRTLSKRHSLRPVTTRRDYPGHHAVDLMINGKVVASAAFELLA